MKRYDASAALALMFGGVAAVVAGCPGYTFETPPFQFDGCSCETMPEPCHINQCENGGTCTQVVVPSATGTSCAMGKECNEMGECLLVNGQPCKNGAECRSGFCADGVCCESTCDGECQACNIPGADFGKCVMALPDGWPDDSCKELVGTACLNQKCTPGGALGVHCGDDDNICLNKTCSGGYCRLDIDEPCNDPVQCRTNYCDLKTNKCAQPKQDMDCTSGVMSMINGLDRCHAAPGEPCDGSNSSSIDCMAEYTCFFGICVGENNAPCTADYVCRYNYCNIADDQTTGTCADCPSIMTCFQGFPTGAYCNNNADCASGNCTGFPQKCQPTQP